MKTKDIVAGQKYRHTDHPRTLYMGVGGDGKNSIHRKHLVIIKDTDRYFVGRVVAPQSEWSSQKFWTKFYPVESWA